MPADTTPDLFSTHAPAKASEPPTAPQERAAAQPRHFLPKDLAGALKQLGDPEIDALLSAVTTEAERRGRLSVQPLKEKFAADAKTQAQQAPNEAVAGSLTTGKLNAVRAAFKAGVSSTTARTGGCSRPPATSRPPSCRSSRPRPGWLATNTYCPPEASRARQRRLVSVLRNHRGPGFTLALRRPDCLAGHVGLEPANPSVSYLIGIP